jgi:hypothetical protein
MGSEPKEVKGKAEKYGEKLGALLGKGLGKGLDWVFTAPPKKPKKKEEK